VSTHRLFLLAPALARLIQRERGSERVQEGYFPDQPRRSAYVQVEETRSSLILEPDYPEGAEERADLPVAHGQALRGVAQGQVEYVRTHLAIGPRDIELRHFMVPGPLDLVAVPAAPEETEDLPPLPWFGREVTTEPAYQHRHLALRGQPDTLELELTNAALHSLLDLLENRGTTWPGTGEQPATPADEDAQPSKAPVRVASIDTDEETGDLDIEDAVLRELARSLKPRR
jgi:CYTH domain-containing protein